MMKLPTIDEYWKLSREERERLYEEEGITGRFLAQWWKPYNNPGGNQVVARLASIRGVKQAER